MLTCRFAAGVTAHARPPRGLYIPAIPAALYSSRQLFKGSPRIGHGSVQALELEVGLSVFDIVVFMQCCDCYLCFPFGLRFLPMFLLPPHASSARSLMHLKGSLFAYMSHLAMPHCCSPLHHRQPSLMRLLAMRPR